MKTLIILAIAILGCVNAMGQQTVDLDKASQRLKKSDLPFKSCKVMAYTNQGVEYRGKACATYRDLSRKRKSQEETGEMYVPFWFEVGKTDASCFFCGAERFHACLTEMLVTYKGNREADRLETKLYFNNDIAVKQWQLTAEGEVIVYELVFAGDTGEVTEDGFAGAEAQRVDTYYRISRDGTFEQAKEVRYAPKYYTAEELGDKTKNIWDGDETVL